MKTWKLLAVALTVLQSSIVAQAAVSVGGRTFADNAFADAISLPAVTYLLWNGVTSNVQTSTNPALAAAAALDTPITQPTLSTSTFAGCADGQSEAVCGTVVIFFHDNRIVNGAGIDFTIFDVNNPATVKVTIGGTSIVRSTVLAGSTPRPSALGSSPWNLNAADFDLTDFGIASGATIGSFELNWGYGANFSNRTAIALVGAVNSVPEPSGTLMIGAGTICVLFTRRQRIARSARGLTSPST